MTDSIWLQIADTPWWVYAFFIYFLYVGYLATKPRVVSFKAMFLPTGIFTGISLICILLSPLVIRNIPSLLLAAAAGSLLGWLQYRFMKLKVMQNKSAYETPGSWNLFFIIILLIFLKFYFAFEINFNLFLQQDYVDFFLILYSFSIGLFLGRLFYCLRRS
jgi:hypothetical protein